MSENDVENLVQQGIDAGFVEQVTQLFRVLASSPDDPRSIDRFVVGLSITKDARQMAMVSHLDSVALDVADGKGMEKLT